MSEWQDWCEMRDRNQKRAAKAMEARRAVNAEGGAAEDDSAVAEGHAPKGANP